MKKLYRVKALSSGRVGERIDSVDDKDKLKINKEGYLSNLWNKLDSNRMGRIMKSLKTWK